MFRSIWPPEDHPILIDVDGEIPLGHTPDEWDRISGAVDSTEGRESRARRGVRRVDDLARHCLLELGFVRNPRRGPIRSHQTGRRGWRDRLESPPDAAVEALYRRAEDALFGFTETGYGYTNDAYSHFEQRPCLIEHIALKKVAWCTRERCAGCRTNHENDHLFGGSEVWTTNVEPGPREVSRPQDHFNAMRHPSWP